MNPRPGTETFSWARPRPRLPDDPEPRELLAGGTAPADVAARYPTSSPARAQPADEAFERGSVVEAYAYACTGCHRGLDSLRRGGWKGHGPVRWENGATCDRSVSAFRAVAAV